MNLDDDLAAWAAAARLTAADADAIFRRIVVTPVAATPVPATPVPATPVPATPVPATPVPATPAPAAPRAGDRAGHVLATTAPGLDPAWWRRYTAGFAAGMVASTAPLRSAA